MRVALALAVLAAPCSVLAESWFFAAGSEIALRPDRVDSGAIPGPGLFVATGFRSDSDEGASLAPEAVIALNQNSHYQSSGFDGIGRALVGLRLDAAGSLNPSVAAHAGYAAVLAPADTCALDNCTSELGLTHSLAADLKLGLELARFDTVTTSAYVGGDLILSVPSVTPIWLAHAGLRFASDPAAPTKRRRVPRDDKDVWTTP